MQHLSAHELEKRFKDIFLNQLVLTEDKQMGLNSMDEEGKYWIEVFTHLCEEFQLRYGPYPAGFKNGFVKDVKIPDPRLDAAAKVCDIVKRLKIDPGKYLIKYGQRKWLKDTLTKGIIRISPSTSYNDASLNSAIQDNELKFSIYPNPSELNLEAFDGKTGASKGRLDVIKAEIVQESTMDYYVYCLSSIFTPRLFVDFDADACLIIKKPIDFINNLIATFEKDSPERHGICANIKYLDPLNTKPHQVNIFSCKHFRYSYQKEVRLSWLPSKNEIDLKHRFVELGNLENIAEMVSI